MPHIETSLNILLLPSIIFKKEPFHLYNRVQVRTAWKPEIEEGLFLEYRDEGMIWVHERASSPPETKKVVVRRIELISKFPLTRRLMIIE